MLLVNTNYKNVLILK